MGKRIITTVIGLPVLIFIVYTGGYLLLGALLILSVIGLYEFYHTLSKKILPIHFSGFIFAGLYFYILGVTADITLLLILLPAFILVSMLLLVIFYNKTSFADCIISISGFFYVPFLLSFIFLVREHSIYFVWLIFISASSSDTFAYLIGRKWGKHRLAGSPSPSKTWEGSVGGIAGAGVVGLIYAYLMPYMTILDSLIITLGAAVFSQVGDLFASAAKRSAGAKDFGKILPGHGGILDRFDSIMVTGPVIYILMIMTERLLV